MTKNIFAYIIFFSLLVTCFAALPTSTTEAAGIAIPANTGLPDPVDGTGQGPVVQVAVNILGWILGVFMLLAVMAFVYTGIQYLMTMGDQYKAENAKKALTYSILGVAVVGGALILINTIDLLLS